jgi:hypothetical protein
MVVGEFTSSSIVTDEGKREDEVQAKKDAQVDYSKLEGDIEANKSLAAQVELPRTLFRHNFAITNPSSTSYCILYVLRHRRSAFWT